MPNYRGWVVLAALVVVCLATWAHHREDATRALRCGPRRKMRALVQAFGVNVPRHDHPDLWRWCGARRLRRRAGRADLFGEPQHGGSNFINTVFAVVVIGGMGSRSWAAIISGFGLGIIEGLTKVYLPPGFGHCGVRHHGDRAADATGRLLRKGKLRSAPRSSLAPSRPGSAAETCSDFQRDAVHRLSWLCSCLIIVLRLCRHCIRCS